MNSVRANITTWKVLSAICALFFSACFVGALLSRAYAPAGLIGIFLFLSAVLLLAYGPVQAGEEEISMLAPTGFQAIRWDEMRRIKCGRSHLVFIGENKRLTVPHPMFWTGKDKKLVAEVLELFCRKSGITPTNSFTADLRLSKKCKNRRQAGSDNG